ncbi:MAG: NADH pyrophosphatase, partial [Caldilineaceae bacterium]|nr:NADH pyrophosphatase [Caldilineaceae bacterium]
MMAQSAAPTFTPGIKAPESASPARWYLYQGDRLVLDERNGDPALLVAVDVAALGLAPLRTEYLGRLEGAEPIECFSGEIASEAELPPGFAAHELR